MRSRDSTSATRLSSSRSFGRFVLVGGVGFCVDASILAFLTHYAHWSPWYARLPSFLSAVSVTWLINRRYTFPGRGLDRPAAEAAWYAAIQSAGALINLAMFGLVLARWGTTGFMPVIALAIGAIGGLVCNFSMSNFLLYRRARMESPR